MSRKSLLKNSFIYALGDIIPKMLSFISFPILTTYLSPAEYGIVNYVNSINIFLSIATFLCLNTYFLVYFFKQVSVYEQKKLLGNLTIFTTALNLIVTIIIFAFGGFLFSKIGGNISFFPYIAIGVAINFFNNFSILPSALFRVLEHPLPLTLLNVFKGIIMLFITLYLVIVCGFGALGVLYSSLAVSVVFSFIFIIITIKKMIWHVDWEQIRNALKFSLPLVPGAVSYYLLSISDRILIDKYLSLSDLGIYSTASTLALILNIVSYGAYKAFEPYFFKISNSENFISEFKLIHNYFLLVIILGSMGLAVFGREFLISFSSTSYHQAYIYVPLILISVVVLSLTLLYGTIITAQGKTKINSAITIIGGCMSVCLNIFLLKYLGIFAACISSSLAALTMLSLSILFSRVRIGYKRTLGVVLLSFLVVWLLVYVISFQVLWMSLLFKSIILIFTSLIMVKILEIDLYSVWRHKLLR